MFLLLTSKASLEWSPVPKMCGLVKKRKWSEWFAYRNLKKWAKFVWPMHASCPTRSCMYIRLVSGDRGGGGGRKLGDKFMPRYVMITDVECCTCLPVFDVVTVFDCHVMDSL